MRLHHAKEIEIEQKRIIRFNFFFPFSVRKPSVGKGGEEGEEDFCVLFCGIFPPFFFFLLLFLYSSIFYEEHAQGMPFACKSSMSPRH